MGAHRFGAGRAGRPAYCGPSRVPARNGVPVTLGTWPGQAGLGQVESPLPITSKMDDDVQVEVDDGHDVVVGAHAAR